MRTHSHDIMAMQWKLSLSTEKYYFSHCLEIMAVVLYQSLFNSCSLLGVASMLFPAYNSIPMRVEDRLCSIEAPLCPVVCFQSWNPLVVNAGSALPVPWVYIWQRLKNTISLSMEYSSQLCA